MPKLTTVDLTRRESQIMEILYRRRRATVEEVRAELPEAPSPSSVRKLLDIMIERGLLAREYDGPRYVYFPAVKPEDASRSALKQSSVQSGRSSGCEASTCAGVRAPRRYSV
jgi:predicted transcriptional regulator